MRTLLLLALAARLLLRLAFRLRFGFLLRFRVGFLFCLRFGLAFGLRLGLLLRLRFGLALGLRVGFLLRFRFRLASCLRLGFALRRRFGFLARLRLGFASLLLLGDVTRFLLGFLARLLFCALARLETATLVAMAARTDYLRSFVNTDVIGTEFGGVLKNLIAVAIGIVDGVGYGENTKAAIITRGLVEMTDFAVAYGAKAETLAGLAGLGDLIATCESPLSRNNTAGRLLGQGYSFTDVVAQMNQTAEGLASVAPILELAMAKGVEMPIVSQVAEVLAGTMNPRDIAPHLTSNSDEPQREN